MLMSRVSVPKNLSDFYCNESVWQGVGVLAIKMLRSGFYSVVIFLFVSSFAYAEDDFWVEMSHVEPGQLLRTEWEGKQIAVLFRTEEMISALQLKYESTSVMNNTKISEVYRSLTADYFVFFDQFNGSNCRLEYIGLGEGAGLLDPCSNIKFDFSGRSDAGLKLELPAYEMVTKTKLMFLGF